MPYVKPKIARQELGVNDATLRRWADSGRIKSIRSSIGGNRLYDIQSFESVYEEEQSPEKRKIIYCRVSSSKQKEDLERQIKYLKEKYPTHEVIKEIASGINFKRKGLKKILDDSIDGMVSEVVVAHKDRLCRISFEHFKWLFNRLGVNLILDSEEDHSTETELANDLMSIVHVFSCRHYGARRKYTHKEKQGSSTEETTETREYES